MRTRRNTHRLTAVALAGALALTACAGEDEQAETTTELTEEERLAALESELAQLREDGGDAPTDDEDDDPDGESDDLDGEDGDGDDDSPDVEGADGNDEDTVEPRVFEVGETQTSGERGDLEVTVERIVVQDYHIEVELTAVNNHSENSTRLWSGFTNTSAPQLFDEQDRRFAYQHPAGYSSGDRVEIGPGQRLDAVLMFGRRLHPDAQVLTLRFRGEALEDWEWNVDLEETER